MLLLLYVQKNNAIVEFFIALQHFQMDVFSQGAKSENGFRHMHKQNVKIISKMFFLAKSKFILVMYKCTLTYDRNMKKF